MNFFSHTKKILIIAAMASIVLPLTTFAVDKEAKQSAQVKAQEQKDEINQKKIENLKTKGAKEIDRRLNSLNKLITKINKIKRISADQKSQFLTEIQKNITELTNLKAKINADTDLETLRADVKSIVESYRIYAVFIPRIHILAGADAADIVTARLTALSTKLETRVAEAKTAGKNVADTESLLADMKAQIASAKTEINKAVESAISATPSGYPGNKGTLQSANKSLSNAKKALNAAKQDASKIIKTLKSMSESKESSSTGINRSGN